LVSLPHINPATIPASWGFTAVKFYLAPTAGTFGGISYQAGFYLQGGIAIFGIAATSNIQITSNDFVFQVSLNKDAIQNAINGKLLDMLQTDQEFRQKLNFTESEINTMVKDKKPLGIVSVSLTTLTGMTMENMASGHNPTFQIDYKYIIHSGKVSFGVPLADLWDSFDNFFIKYLKHLF